MAQVDLKDENFTTIKKNTVFVTMRKSYGYDSLVREGYKVYRAYKEKNLFEKILREIWFKLPLPEKLWYQKDILNCKPKNIIIQDPLITRKYLEWLITTLPDSNFFFMYCNMVGRARHLFPNQIPKTMEIWTYDKHDADKYNIHLYTHGGYSYIDIREKREKLFDVIFVGADKGRGEYLLELQKKLEDIGLKTKFIITADRKFGKRKKYYSKRIPYSDVLKLDHQTKAILNITLPGQQGITLRDYESIYCNVKLITNNKKIKDYDFYNKENIFILGEDKIESLKYFLNTPFINIEDTILKKYTIDNMVKEILYSKTVGLNEMQTGTL